MNEYPHKITLRHLRVGRSCVWYYLKEPIIHQEDVASHTVQSLMQDSGETVITRAKKCMVVN